MGDQQDGKSRGTVSPLLSPLWSDSGWTLLVATTFGNGNGVKIGWAILIPKARTSVPCEGSDFVVGGVLSLESGLVVRSGNGTGFVYSPLMSSPSEVENMAS